jgi:hypothetical protein
LPCFNPSKPQNCDFSSYFALVSGNLIALNVIIRYTERIIHSNWGAIAAEIIPIEPESGQCQRREQCFIWGTINSDLAACHCYLWWAFFVA